jgi:NADPH:quinone reductase-like Zn-dependent oxidoreductase
LKLTLCRLALTDIPSPVPTSSQISISITAAALNHRDLFIRQHLYPAISFSTPLLADGCGIVSTPSSPLYNKRVILTPSQGWASQVSGPEDPRKFSILGGTSTIPIGTLSEVAVVNENEVELAPEHLSDAEAAALPLTGLTAWRALVTKSGEAEEGRNILVTGIGGGVALMALQFAVAKGCNVYVTSGSEEKIEKAKKMGAKGGVNYKGATWEKELLKLLPNDRPVFDAIIDGAGGDVVVRGNKLLKVCFGRFALGLVFR